MKLGNLLRRRWLILIIVLTDGASSLLGRQALHAQNEGKHTSVAFGAWKCDQSPSTSAVVLGTLAVGFLFIAHLATTLAGRWRAYTDTFTKCNFCLFLILVSLYAALSIVAYEGARLLWSGVRYNVSIIRDKDHSKCSSFFSSERVFQGWGESASLVHLVGSLAYCGLCFFAVEGICGCCVGGDKDNNNNNNNKGNGGGPNKV